MTDRNGRTVFTAQATVWRDRKQVALLHNCDVKPVEEDNNTTQRWSPRSKRRRTVGSPTIISTYNENYNGVDRMDRDRADWSISIKSNRWYLRFYYWIIDGAINHAYITVCEIAKQRSLNGVDHPWLKYTKRDGRKKFQLDLAHSLISRGILMDQPNAKLLKEKKHRPGYMRKEPFHPCGCGVCFFCKHNLTHGVEHKSWHFRDYKPTPPPGGDAEHPKKSVPIGTTGDCKVCYERESKRYPELSKRALRKQTRNGKRVLGRSSKGCNVCGVRVCDSCWRTYNHDLSS